MSAGDPFSAQLQRCRELLTDGAFAEGEALTRALHDAAVAADAWQVAGQAALFVAKLKANTAQALAALEWTERSIAHAGRAGDDHLAAAAWVVFAGAAAEADRPGDALDALGRATALADDAMPQPMRRSVLTGVSIAYNALGLPRLALPAARQAFEADRADGVPAETMRARWNLLVTGLRAHEELATVDPPAAAALLAELDAHVGPLREEALAAGSTMGWAGACHGIGNLKACQGRYDEAIALLEEVVRTPTEETAGVMRDRWVDLAQAQHDAGRLDAARASALQAEAWGARVEEPPGYQDLTSLVQIEALLGRHEAALALHRQYHARVVHMLGAAVDHQVAELAASLGQRTLQLENVDLRQRYAELASQAERLGREARTDALTGVLTRRALHEAFDAMLRRVPGGVAVGALLIVDLDHFKQINDRHSHLVGDGVLRAVAALLAGELRLPDAVGRYGGEEFVVLLAGVDGAQARRIAERLLAGVRAHDWERLAPGLQVGFSGGLAELRPGETFESAFARADALLYRAKAHGRGRIETEAPPPGR